MRSKIPPATTIAEYIGRFPKETQKILQQVRRTIRRAAPEATEAIRYQIPTFVWHENLVHFAAWTHHVSFYPSASGIRHFQGELRHYTTSKGTVQFPYDQPIPHDLIHRITTFRVAEAAERAEKRRKRT